MLSEDAPPAVRWQVVKMLFEARIQNALPALIPESGSGLVESETRKAREKRHFDTYSGSDMDLIPQ